MKYQFFVLIFILHLFPLSIFAQQQVHKRAQKSQELAFIHFRQGDTTNAREFALKAIKKDSLYATPWVLLGNIYEEQKQNDRAIDAYIHALKIDSVQFTDLFYVLAELEVDLKRFDDAKQHILKYLSLNKASEREQELAEFLFKTIDFRKNAYANPVKFIHKNIGEPINSEHDEYVNSVSTDERSMFITIKKSMGADPQGRLKFSENIYLIDFDSTKWINLRLIRFEDKPIIGAGGASISPNNRYLFFTVCNSSKGEGSCDLFYSKIENEKFTKEKKLGSVVNSNSWDSQPCFSSDGKSLFFASKRAGGFGGSDIWISELNKDGRFQKPFNAGATINTSGDEMAPLIHYDAKTLYFSSNGHIGMGGFDLFISKTEDSDQWSKPKNLGYPINTANDEVNLMVSPDGRSAHISSDQIEGYGGFDIYKFKLNKGSRPNPVTYVQGLIYDAESGKKLQAKVELNILSSGKQFSRTESDLDEGSFLVVLPLNEMIGMNVNKEGYMFHSEHYNAVNKGTKANPAQIKIPLQKIKLGTVEVLNNIFFETDKFELMEASFPELKKVIQLMKENPSIVIEISGHTDDVGTDKYNQVLSEKRAQAVMNYLTQFVNEFRLSSKGYGFEQPIDTNDTEIARSKNRRIEFKVVGLRN